jgi:hypothetical protein
MLPSLRDPKQATEYPKALAQWLDLNYFRHPGRLLRLRRQVPWVVLLASALAMAGVAFVPGGRRNFQAGPVAPAHSRFNERCEACHDIPFGVAMRLVKGDESMHSVADPACLKCHNGAIHHARQVGEAHCAGCHREHRGRVALARVEDGYCTACHADLKAHTETSIPRDAALDEHDKGRVFQDVGGYVGGAHPHPKFTLPDDPGTIRFPHDKHMDPRGVLVPGSSNRRALQCITCHEMEPEHRPMRAIRYERNCRECHPLTVQVYDETKDWPEPARAASARFRATPAPHPARPGEDASTVLAVLRDRYLRFAREFGEVIENPSRPVPGPAPSLPRLRGSRSVAASPSIQAAADWAERQLGQVDRLLLRGEGGCLYCHPEAPRGGPAAAPDGLPVLLAPRIRERWLTHSVFSHHSHRALECQECHAGASKSTQASDVLMPQIDACRKCHTGQVEGARSDCVECHTYHPPGATRRPERAMVIEEFLKGRTGGAPPPVPVVGTKRAD